MATVGIVPTRTPPPTQRPSRYALPLVFFLAAAARFFLYHATDLAGVLGERVEIANSFVSAAYMGEVSYLLKRGIRIYDYATCLPMPLAVLLSDLFAQHKLEGSYFVLLDFLVAYYLSQIAFLKFGTASRVPVLVAATYLFNPFNLLPAIAKTSTALTSVTLVGALYHAMAGDPAWSLFHAAFGTYLSLYPVTILAPVVTLLGAKMRKRAMAAVFASWMAAFLVSSCLFTGSWRFLSSSHGCRLTFSSLKPNVGLYWYLFIEMFDFFRPFFASFLQLHILFYGFPIAVRFRRDPLFMALLVIAVQALLQPYPTIADAGLYLSMLVLHGDIVRRMRFIMLVAVGILFAAVLAPVNWHLWIVQGSGNANFYYATTLIYNLAQTLLIIDVTRTYVWGEVLALNPHLRASDLHQK